MMQQVRVTPVMYTAPDPYPGTRQSYNSCFSKCLGATQMAIGAACILFHIIGVVMNAGLHQVYHGVWCGIFFIFPGVFGVLAGNTKRTGYIITFMTLSIIAATLFVTPLLACAAIGLSIDNTRYYPYYYSYYGYRTTTRPPSQIETAKFVNGLLIGLAVLEGIIAIISSAICCGPLCCSGSTQGTVYTQGQVQVQPGTGQQVIVMPNMATAAGVQNQNMVTLVPGAGAPGPAPYIIQGTQMQAQPGPSIPPPYTVGLPSYTGEQLPNEKV